MNKDESSYYSIRLRKAAREFGISEDEARHLLRRGALEAQFREGEWWVHLGLRRGENRRVILWHGTSEDRIYWIRKHGLDTATKGREVWLTTSELRARKHAIGRSSRRNSVPFLVCCEVDLEMYQLFWKLSPQLYVFSQPLGLEVIQKIEKVDEREWNRRFRLQLRRERRKSLVNVEVTRNAGSSGVLYWINMYLDEHGLQAVTEDDPVVCEIVEWVRREYEAGRAGPILSEELEARAQELLSESGRGGNQGNDHGF